MSDVMAHLGKSLADTVIKKPDRDPESVKTILLQRFAALQVKHRFRPGDLVQIRPGLRMEKFPYDGEPGIVVEVLDSPIFDTSKNSDSPYFRDKLDIIIGIIHADGGFLRFHMSSDRLEPWGTPSTTDPQPIV